MSVILDKINNGEIFICFRDINFEPFDNDKNTELRTETMRVLKIGAEAEKEVNRCPCFRANSLDWIIVNCECSRKFLCKIVREGNHEIFKRSL